MRRLYSDSLDKFATEMDELSNRHLVQMYAEELKDIAHIKETLGYRTRRSLIQHGIVKKNSVGIKINPMNKHMGRCVTSYTLTPMAQDILSGTT